MRLSHLSLAALALSLLAWPLHAPDSGAQQMESVPQAQSAPSATAPVLKVGVLDLNEAVGRTKEGQKASEDLQAQFSPRNAELQKLAQEIQELENQLRMQERTLSDDARLQIARRIDQKRRTAQRLQEDFQADLQIVQNEHLGKIWANMQKVIDQYAREKGYGVVINSAATNPSPVIYAASAVDITEDIIRLYDQQYPVQEKPAASGGQAKPAPKPAPPPAQTPPPPAQPKPPQP